MYKTILIICLLSFASCKLRPLAQFPGGNYPQEITPEIRKDVISFLSKANQVSNSPLLSTLLTNNAELILYETQVVAGVNYKMVFENENKYFCVKIFRNLDEKYALSYANQFLNLQMAMGACEFVLRNF